MIKRIETAQGVAKIRVVEEVEELAAELEIDALCEVELAVGCEIRLPGPEAAHLLCDRRVPSTFIALGSASVRKSISLGDLAWAISMLLEGSENGSGSWDGWAARDSVGAEIVF